MKLLMNGTVINTKTGIFGPIKILEQINNKILIKSSNRFPLVVTYLDY